MSTLRTQIEDLAPGAPGSVPELPLRRAGMAFLRDVTTGGTSTSPTQSEEDNALSVALRHMRVVASAGTTTKTDGGASDED